MTNKLSSIHFNSKLIIKNPIVSPVKSHKFWMATDM